MSFLFIFDQPLFSKGHMSDTAPLLEVKDLKTHFSTFEGVAKAVDDVTFHVDKGEVLGIVGESGCGKSVTAQSIMRLIPDPPGCAGP